MRFSSIIFIILLMIFPFTLMNITIENIDPNLILGIRASLVFFCVFFYMLERGKTKLDKNKIYPMFFVLIVISVLNNFSKMSIDLLVLLILTNIFSQNSYKEKQTFSIVMSNYYFILPIILVLLEYFDIDLKSHVSSHWADNQYGSSFGMKNRNNISYFMYTAQILYFYRRKVFLTLFSSVPILLTYGYTETKTTLILSLLTSLFILAISINSVRFIFKRFYYLSISILISILLLFFLVFYGFLPQFQLTDESILIRQKLIQDVSVNISSKSLLIGGVPTMIDNLYLNILLGSGAIILLFIIYKLIRATFTYFKNESYSNFFLLYSIILMGFVEHSLFSNSLLSIIVFYLAFYYKDIITQTNA